MNDNVSGTAKIFQGRRFLQNFAGVVLLVLIACGLYYLATIFIALDKELKAALIAGAFAVGIALATNYIQRKRELDFKIREKKTEAYQTYFDFLKFFLRSMRSKDAVGTEEFVKWFHDVNYAFIIWGSEPILRSWQEFFRWLSTQNVQNLDKPGLALYSLLARNKMAEVIALIRKDLGHSDKGLDLNVICDLYMPLNFTSEDWANVDEALKRENPASRAVKEA